MSGIVFAFASDGTDAQLLGMACAARGLRGSQGLATAKLAVPAHRMEAATRCLEAAWPEAARLVFPVRESSADRYFVQLGLASIIEESKTDDVLVCIDYDHLVLAQSPVPFDAFDGSVLASSEVRALVPPEAAALFASCPALGCLNASLLIGRAGELRRITRQWHDAYDTIAALVPVRCRTEIALGLAALRAEVLVVPCPTELQGSFATGAVRPALFHYGGDSIAARDMKLVLATLASELQSSTPTADVIDAATAALRARFDVLVAARRGDR